MKRRIRIDLAYDGTRYAGWQFQRAQPTVQGIVEAELTKLQGGQAARLNGAGRTDAGVHARGQVADCLLETRLDDADLAYALRRLLPPDIRPVAVRTVAWKFHSRKDAVDKNYTFRLDLSRHGDPFAARFAVHHPGALDVALMRQALALLPGRRDWTGFTSSRCDKEYRVRRLKQATFDRPSAGVGLFTFAGDGFLRYMVRNIVGTMLEVGAGRIPVERIEEILATRDRNLAGPTAPARGLCLERVDYPAELASGGSRM